MPDSSYRGAQLPGGGGGTPQLKEYFPWCHTELHGAEIPGGTRLGAGSGFKREDHHNKGLKKRRGSRRGGGVKEV